MMILAFVALGQVDAVPAPRAAPPAAPLEQAAPSATGLAAARRLLKAIDVERQYDQAFARLIPPMTKQVFGSIKDNVKVPANVRSLLNEPDMQDRAERDFAKRLMAGFRKRYPALIEEAARAYAQAFSVDELNALVGFYESPLGQKTLAVLPDLQNRMFAIGARLGYEVGSEAIEETLDALVPKPGAVTS